MAKKKRVTLPKDFKELIETGDIEKLEAIYDLCELSATYDGRYGMNTALHYYGVPNELVRWLVKQGLDVNIENYYGRSPLYVQSTGGRDTVKLLFELGADIEKPDRYGNRPLHAAASFFRVDTVRFWWKKGQIFMRKMIWSKRLLKPPLRFAAMRTSRKWLRFLRYC